MSYVEFHRVRTSLGINFTANFSSSRQADQAGSRIVVELIVLNASFRT